ncbi:alpha/beta hydrolase family esterase [Effusibacillus consociatus]|uniref:Alpha/beta hydrolase family esterase n=1 Tax=Effusibacillus consociatus TaxID=1117041 RepID=A0ABV9Q3H9_9BACL
MRSVCVRIFVFLLAVVLVLSAPAGSQKIALAEGKFLPGSYTNEYGTRNYQLYIPSGYRGQAVPLLVMLHGCTQDPTIFAAGTKMNQLAEQQTFLVLYPEQPSSANASKCWNWFLPEHQERDKGELSLIAGMTKQVMNNYHIDKNRTYVAGMSAGGAMSAIMGSAYPDLFAAVGISAGLEYKAATDLISALEAMKLGGPDPNRQGVLAYVAAGSNARAIPLIVFHGALDKTVFVVNGEQVISQFAQTNDLFSDGLDNQNITDQPSSVSNGQVPDGHSYTVSVYKDPKGNPLMEKWIVEGMDHAWSGGTAGIPYNDPKGPDASREMTRFFFEHPKNK